MSLHFTDLDTLMGQGNQPRNSVGIKTRGRPRKSFDGDRSKDEVRARGRESQREFRLRQQALLKQLQQRTISLEDVIEAMSNEFMALGDYFIQSEHVVKHPEMLVDVKKRIERFHEIACSVESESIDDNSSPYQKANSLALGDDTVMNSSKDTGENFDAHSFTPSAATPHRNNKEKPLSDFAASMPATVVQNVFHSWNPAISQAYSMPTGTFSPRLDYGLFGVSPSQSQSFPQMQWSQYMIAGPDTFAMRLYIDTLDKLWKALQGEINIQGFIPSVCRYRFRYERPDAFADLIRRQLKLINPGYDKQDVIFRHEEENHSLTILGPSDYALINLIPKIIKDAEQELGSLDDWLDPWGAQQYITLVWGIKLTSTTASIPARLMDNLNFFVQPQWEAAEGFSPSDINVSELSVSRNGDPGSLLASPKVRNEPTDYAFHGFGDNSPTYGISGYTRNASNGNGMTQIHSVQSLVQQLSISAVCFGDGPRFLKTELDNIIQEFLQQCRS